MANASQVRTPAVLVRYSDDGGASWSAARALPIGVQGATRTRIKTLRLGVSGAQGRTYEISCSAAVMRAVLALAVDIEKLPA